MSGQEVSQEAEAAQQAGDDEESAPQPASELDYLKDRAKKMGITHSGNIGVEALKAKIEAKMNGEKVEPEKVEDPNAAAVAELQAQIAALQAGAPVVAPSELNPLAGDVAGETPARKLTLREQVRKDALKLIRVRIQNLDPKKRDLNGEIFTVGNKYVGTIKKFVPYGAVTDDGWHLPYMLYENLRERKFLNIRTFKDRKTGRDRQEDTWEREFAFEVLPQLTPEELGKLAAAQMAANNT